MTDQQRSYNSFRAKLIIYMLEHETTPAQVADWLEKDGRADGKEIRTLRESKDWFEAHLKTVPPRRIHPTWGPDYLWHSLTGRTEIERPHPKALAHWDEAPGVESPW